MRSAVLWAFLLAMVAFGLPLQAGEPLQLVLPTDNRALLDGHPEDFYQFIDRDFHGEKTTPWEGGQYGFVRDPIDTEGGVFCRRFHEGIDIKPVHRDARGIPQDEVRAIADGEAVYINEQPRASNYGRYVVIRHIWDGCPYYSLYAHLASSRVQAGQMLKRGEALGIMGSTGEGLDNRRAHLHLELNLMLGDGFETWHAATFPSEANKHGIYNGLNLAGMDIASLFLALQRDPSLTIPQFLASEKVIYKVLIPAGRPVSMVQTYPWLLNSDKKDPGAWEISFTGAGLPIHVQAVVAKVDQPFLSWLAPLPSRADYFTRRFVTGTNQKAVLSPSGLTYIGLLAPSPTVAVIRHSPAPGKNPEL